MGREGKGTKEGSDRGRMVLVDDIKSGGVLLICRLQK